MKVAIIGPGALGCLLAASLVIRARKKYPSLDLWLLDHNPKRAKLLAKQGLVLEEGGQVLHGKVNVTTATREIGTADIIFLCVKSPDVAAALKQASQIAHAESLLVTLQNGIGHLKILKTSQAPPVVVLGTTAQGANLVADGHVRHAGSGLTRIGYPKSANFAKSLLLSQACNLLNAGGLETVIVDNILDYVWAKLLVNVGINALTAIHRCPNGTLLEMADTREKMAAAVKEGEAVALALGISLTDDPLAMTREICRKTAQNLSSMLQDATRQRPTEIDSINGEIVAAGRKLGIPVPMNEELVAQVKEIERSYRQSATMKKVCR